MKKVYKLGSTYFNIDYLRNVSELKVIDEYEETEVRKRIDKEVDERCLHFQDRFTKIPPVHVYPSYSKGCKTIQITIDDKEHSCRNYDCENAGFTFSASTTERKIEEFDRFRTEALELLEAFKKL